MNKAMHARPALPSPGYAASRNQRRGERRKKASKGYIYLSMVGWYCRREKTRRKVDLFS